MFYPNKLKKEAANPAQMGQQMAQFFQNLAQPTSVNNAVRPQIMNQLKPIMQQAAPIMKQASSPGKILLGVGVGTALGDMVYQGEQKATKQKQQFQNQHPHSKLRRQTPIIKQELY